MKLSQLALGLVIGAVGLGLLAPVPSVGQASRTWTVCPQGGCDFQRIQEAIDAAADGDTILIQAPGIYYENITITKSLTIAPYQSSAFPVILQPAGAFIGPVITVKGERAIQVTLKDLIVQGVAADQSVAISIAGQAHVVLTEIEVGPSVYFGLIVDDQAQVIIQNSRFHNNGTGLEIGASVQVTVENSVFFNNRVTDIGITQEGQLRLIRSTVYGSDVGISAHHTARVIIEDSQIYRHVTGIGASDSSTIELVGSAVAYNRKNGINLNGQANLLVKESVIHNNGDWGISAWLIKCGFDRDQYRGGTVQIDPSTVLVKNGKGDICLP